MTKYLISFPSSAMNHIPQEDFPAVAEAAHAVLREAKSAGVWVFGGGRVVGCPEGPGGGAGPSPDHPPPPPAPYFL